MFKSVVLNLSPLKNQLQQFVQFVVDKSRADKSQKSWGQSIQTHHSASIAQN